MQIYSLFYLAVLLVAILGMSYGFTYFSHHLDSNTTSNENRQQVNRGRGYRNLTDQPTGSSRTGSSPSGHPGSLPSRSTPPTGSSHSSIR